MTGALAERLDQLWFRGHAKLRLYRCLVLTERRLTEPFPDLPLPADLTVRHLTPDDAAAYATFRPEHGRGEYERRLAEGHWCFAAWRGAEIVSAAWAVARRGWIEYLELGIQLGPHEVYSYDLYTVPELRGRRITPPTRVPHLRYLREQGYCARWRPWVRSIDPRRPCRTRSATGPSAGSAMSAWVPGGADSAG